MERTAWTDERLDDAMTRIDSRFDTVDQRFDRLELRIDRLEAELRTEMRTGVGDLRHDMHQMALAIGVGYLGLAAAVVAAVT